jgi:calcineurin-like phosphoesterase family protein
MSRVFFISDLHLGHAGILKHTGDYRTGKSIEEHDEILIGKIKSRVSKRDVLYILGDVSWRENKLHLLYDIPGLKYLVRGNHDNYSTEEYLNHFKNVYGLHKKGGAWLSHAPVHPDELRGCINIHGHVHQQSIMGTDGQYDPRYINVSVEALEGYPIDYQDILSGRYQEIRKC